MTIVKCNKADGRYKIDVEGHAEDSLVCCSISTLGFTLMCAIDNIETEEKEFTYNDGEIHIDVMIAEGIDTVVNTIMLGFMMLEQKYPEKIRLEWLGECSF